ncbi:MAG: exosortase system-associated protein, TIGR04073 family [Acidobacteria bacterium]|nr:exosortase system-associated protein, TIGR04073 family [Acidobacteriota bacterium]
MRLTLSAAIFFAVVISVASSAGATGKEQAASTPGQKALRGATNLSLGLVLELPRTIYYETKQQGPLLGIPAGFLAGFGLGLMRTAVGAYELLTFPIALPDDYKPILTPPFPFEQGRTRVSPALIERPKETTHP